jgi:nucleotide-binding universal stress UspA family protein
MAVARRGRRRFSGSQMTRPSDDPPVLFAYDGSDRSKQAIRTAARELRPGRRALVLTVWQPIAALPFASGLDGPPGLDAASERQARRVAEQGSRLAGSLGFAAEALAASGAPIWRAIVDAAREHRAELVVMGSHARGALGRMVLGSVAASVARHAERPVLILHAA